MTDSHSLSDKPTAQDHAIVAGIPSGIRSNFGLRMRSLQSKFNEGEDISIPGKQVVDDFKAAGGTQEQWNALVQVATQINFSL